MINLKYLFFLLLLINTVVFLWSLRSGDIFTSKPVINVDARGKQIMLVSEITDPKPQKDKKEKNK